jgi:isopenicillin N synthase-like dioxygenase
VRPLCEDADGEYIHYGSHFTNMFMRSYRDRITTQRILQENRLAKLMQPHEIATSFVA